MLHILGTASVAGTGIASMVDVLARQLDPTEFSLAACFLGPGGPWSKRLRGAGVSTLELPWTSPLDGRGALRFWRYLRAQQLDVVHLHHGGRSVRRLSRWTTGARLVVHVHGRVRHEGDYRPVPVVLPDADVAVATSRAVAQFVQARRVEVIYPGVPSMPRGGNADPWTIGAAGRLVPIKGYQHLIEAFAAVHARHPQARLEIAGDGPLRVDLESQAQQRGLGDAIRFHGWVEDLAGAMSSWSVFVQPSLEEALGITVLQAMAGGVAVVASDVGGLSELVDPGVSGALVPPGDSVALAAAISDMLADPGRRARFVAAAERKAGAFSEQRFATEVARVYRSLRSPGPEAA